MNFSTTIAITFVVYLAAMWLIGIYAYRRTSDATDFFLGGRKLGSLVAALSAGASDMSGWLLLGLPGYAYAAGLEAFWLAFGLLAGTYLNWRFLAQRLRVFSENADNALTLPSYFASRFGDPNGILRGSSAFFILLFFLFYTSSGLVAGGKLFESVFGIPYVWAVAFGTAAIILYTALGGFLAVSWTDLVQALLMAAALIAVPIMALAQGEGPSQTLAEVNALNPHLMNAFTGTDGAVLSWIAIVSLLGWGLGYFGQPHILARFMAIQSPTIVPRARRIAVTWVTFALVGSVLAGLAGITGLETPLHGVDVEKVFILLVNTMFHPVIAGVCLAAILAAIMSTADSQLMVASAAFTEDIYQSLFGKSVDEKRLMLIGRAAVVVIALVAFALALNPESKVLDLVAYAWAGFGAAFGPALIISLYWRGMTRSGALAGILSGGLTVVIWNRLSEGLFDLYELIPGFLVSAAAIVIVSLIDRTPDAKVARAFDASCAQVR